VSWKVTIPRGLSVLEHGKLPKVYYLAGVAALARGVGLPASQYGRFLEQLGQLVHIGATVAGHVGGRPVIDGTGRPCDCDVE
jgi:hypothetical protein